MSNQITVVTTCTLKSLAVIHVRSPPFPPPGVLQALMLPKHDFWKNVSTLLICWNFSLS